MRKAERAAYEREARRAASLLGLPAYGSDVDQAIIAHCASQVAEWAAKHGTPSTTSELLDLVAVSLNMEFVEIHSDSDVAELLARIPPEREPLMARVRDELRDDTDAITLRRGSPEPWERPYLAIINCRGAHLYRRFFSKWHELAHRFVDGEQLKFAFRHTVEERKEPGEILVDKVAAALAFYPDIARPSIQRAIAAYGVTFHAIDAFRREVASDASQYAATLAFAEHAGCPVWRIRCAESLKPSEARMALRGTASTPPVAMLRIQEVSGNQAAQSSGVRFHQWMRVPRTSLVADATESGAGVQGFERLDIWETSDSGPIGYGEIFVDVRRGTGDVLALISLVGDR